MTAVGTLVTDRWGEPYATREVRARMGFIPGELDAEGSEPPSFQQPGHFEITDKRRTSDGENDEPLMRKKGR